MDQQKLRTLVFEKTGVKIDVDDPVFALVALNEAVLAEAVERHVALLDDATRELAGQVEALQAGGAIPARPQLAPARRRPAGGKAWSPSERRMLAVAGAAAVLGALLVLLGQTLFFRPAPLAPAMVQAKELTPEQIKALADGAKLAKAVEKLDQKSRKLIQAEMRKP